MKVYRLKQDKGGIDANAEVVIILTGPTQIRIQRLDEYKANTDFFKAYIQVEEQDAFLKYARDEDLGEKEVVQSVSIISNVRSNDNHSNEIGTNQNCNHRKVDFNVLAVYTLDCIKLPDAWVGVVPNDGVIDPWQLAADVETAIDDMNVAFRNSQIDVEAKLLKIEGNEPYFDDEVAVPVPIDEYKAALLKGNAGQFKRVFDLRAENEADVILFIVGSNSGGPPVGGGLPAKTKYEAFVVIRYDDLLREYTTAHEIGHLFGAEHDAGGYGLHPEPKTGAYAHGYVTEKWRTIMAYLQRKNGQPYGAEVIQHFSNPDVLYEGQPTGTAQANNARQIREYAPTLVALRNT